LHEMLEFSHIYGFSGIETLQATFLGQQNTATYLHL
jgi:hypothetical protein